VSDAVSVVWDDALLGYTMGGDHPMHPVRLDLTMRLAEQLGVLSNDRITVVAPETAGRDLLTLVHDEGYLDAVQKAPLDPQGAGHGLDTDDNPVFEGMYESSALIAGGSVTAARLVHEGKAQHAANIAGGLHHAMRDRAAGFCVFNDAAIAIAWLLGQGYERIAYVDLDVHHGDGVQAAFYDDPRVLTVSIHQTPLTLWPGTGFPEETGSEKAPGTAVNLGLPNGTDDSGWLRAFHAVVPSVVRAFAPQIVVTQCGCDAHHEDPMADLGLTVDGQRASYRAMHDLVHEVCDGKWVALGGGGYGLVRCVPRAWTHLLAEMGGDPLSPTTPVPDSWVRDVLARGLRTEPPASMTEGGWTGFQRWDPFTENRVDRAISRTRAATFPLFGLDPDDPRD
jgi:acetoin utilization protein AcuC